ncbi:hypothetical protein J6590_093661 [Homalodisca vitripennis]|nr:hypothetical protein J6590_093661 [Homalodisca vitripennis]
MKNRILAYRNISDLTGNNAIFNQLQLMKRQYRCALREAKKHSNENFIEGSTNKCKAAWTVINRAQKRTISCGKAPDISPDDFNSFFISSVEEISAKVSASVNSSLAYLENAGSLGLSACCEFSPVSTEDVHGAPRELVSQPALPYRACPDGRRGAAGVEWEGGGVMKRASIPVSQSVALSSLCLRISN